MITIAKIHLRCELYVRNKLIFIHIDVFLKKFIIFLITKV